jgi:CHAT domain-containing protein
VLHLSTHSWSQLDLAALAGAERTVAPRFQVLTNWSGLRAGVALTGDGPRAVSADDDGLLTAAEIAEMDIASELVVLSSCSSVGTLAAGSGLTGLAGAFLRGRVNDLVLTLFDVLDEPTADLMVLFYEELLADPTASVPLALRRAKLKFMMNDEYSDPKFWEAFVVFSRGHTKRV